VWALFGWAALGFDDGVHRVAHALPWLTARPWLAGVVALDLALLVGLHPTWMPSFLTGQVRGDRW
jgi:hypothetical protein